MNILSLLVSAGFDPLNLVAGAIGGVSLDKWNASVEPTPGAPSQKIPAPTNVHVQEEGADLKFTATFTELDGTLHVLTAQRPIHGSGAETVTDNGVVVPGGALALHLHLNLWHLTATVEFDVSLGDAGARYRADGQVEYHKPSA